MHSGVGKWGCVGLVGWAGDTNKHTHVATHADTRAHPDTEVGNPSP